MGLQRQAIFGGGDRLPGERRSQLHVPGQKQIPRLSSPFETHPNLNADRHAGGHLAAIQRFGFPTGKVMFESLMDPRVKHAGMSILSTPG